MATPNMPITYILPDSGWAPLLEIIVRECPARSIIEVNTVGMQALAKRMLGEVGRQDVTVVLRPPPGMASARGRRSWATGSGGPRRFHRSSPTTSSGTRNRNKHEGVGCGSLLVRRRACHANRESSVIA